VALGGALADLFCGKEQCTKTGRVKEGGGISK
jgi:hypothetical protein